MLPSLRAEVREPSLRSCSLEVKNVFAVFDIVAVDGGFGNRIFKIVRRARKKG